MSQSPSTTANPMNHKTIGATLAVATHITITQTVKMSSGQVAFARRGRIEESNCLPISGTVASELTVDGKSVSLGRL
jgi:hypothetical protein